MKAARLPALGAVLTAGALLPVTGRAQPPGSEGATGTAMPPRKVTGQGENLKPFLLARPGGGAYLTWARRDGEKTGVWFAASRDGVSFGAPVRVSAESMDLDLGAESGPQATVAPDGTIYVVWASGSRSVPAITGHKPPPPGAASPDSAELAKPGGSSGAPPRPGNLNVYLASSRDQGRTFGGIIRVNDDPDGPEHRFPTVATDRRGTVYVAWLDKRRQTPERPDLAGVFVTYSTDGGQSFAPNVDATAGQSNGICHCCKVALSVDAEGALAIAFRNNVADMRDIFMVRSRGRGAPFTPPAPIESFRWMIPACPFNGPSLGLDGAGRLHSVWMTGGTVPGIPATGPGAGSRFKVLYRAFDAGKAPLGEPLLLAEGTHPRIAVHPSGRVWVAWEQEGIRVAALSGEGGVIRSLRLTAPEASASFPTLTPAPDGSLLAAWQQRGTDDRWQVWTARVSTLVRKR